MPTNALIALGAGAASAVASLVLVLSLVAPLPLFLVGLSRGPRDAAIACAAGFMVAGLIAGPGFAAWFGLVHAGPAIMVIWLAVLYRTGEQGETIWHPPGQTLAWLALLGAGFFLLSALQLSGESGLEATVREFLAPYLKLAAPDLSVEVHEAFLETFVPLFPALSGALWVISVVVNAVIAQAILARSGRNLRPTPAYVDTVLPDWLSWALVGAAAWALLGTGDMEYIGRNLTVILAVPFLFLGLAVAHAMARRTPQGTWMLGAFYLVFVVSDWAKLVVVGVGVIEQWVGLRRRIGEPDDGQGPDNGEES